MRRRLILTFCTLTLLVLVTFAYPLGRTVIDVRLRQDQNTVLSHAFTIAERTAPDLRKPEGLPDSLQDAVERDELRLVIIDGNGVSTYDSADTSGRTFSNRPEFAAALTGEPNSGIRYSSSLAASIVYAAVPIRTDDGDVVGAVRVTADERQLVDAARQVWLLLGVAAAVTFLAAVGAAIVFARWVTRPLDLVRDATSRRAGGELSARAHLDTGPIEVRHLADVTNQAADRMQDMIAERTRFAADAAHQLRTPLAALGLRLETIMNLHPGEDSDAAMRSYARLANICDALLARARNGKVTPNLQQTELREVCERVTATFGPLGERRHVALTNTVTSLLLATDVTLLETCLGELVVNAIDASPPGAAVELSAERDGDDLLVKVGDRGAGMANEDLERAFDPFWRRQLHPEQVGSSGLGLAQARDLARILGGDVWLTQRHGGGIEAVVRLPAATGGTPKLPDVHPR